MRYCFTNSKTSLDQGKEDFDISDLQLNLSF